MKFALLLSLMVAARVAAQESLSSEIWATYFDAKNFTFAQRDFSVKEVISEIPWTYEIKDRCKGEVEIGEKKWWKFVQAYGPGKPGNQSSEAYFLRSDDKGLWNIPTEGAEAILSVPRPLALGQKWKIGDVEFTFKAIEDLDFFINVVKDCAVIIRQEGNSITKKYYSPGSGLIMVCSKTGEIEDYIKGPSAFSEEKLSK